MRRVARIGVQQATGDVDAVVQHRRVQLLASQGGSRSGGPVRRSSLSQRMAGKGQRGQGGGDA